MMPMAKKARADILACEQGLAPTQDKAARMIMAGLIYYLPDGAELAVLVKKAGDMFAHGTLFTLKETCPYVSRGAYKLLTALDKFAIDVAGYVVLDAGASTGGFTDCLLQHGATRVYAVDSGKGQLHEKLLADSRVISMESTNLRLATPRLLPEHVDMIVADVSFISLKAVLPPCMQFLKTGGKVVALIKPQFEVPANKTVKGVVHNRADREAAVQGVVDFAAAELGLTLQGVVASALKGPKGNQEYLAYFISA